MAKALLEGASSGLSIRAGSRPKQPATDQPLAGYFRLILLLILVRNLKEEKETSTSNV